MGERLPGHVRHRDVRTATGLSRGARRPPILTCFILPLTLAPRRQGGQRPGCPSHDCAPAPSGPPPPRWLRLPDGIPWDGMPARHPWLCQVWELTMLTWAVLPQANGRWLQAAPSGWGGLEPPPGPPPERAGRPSSGSAVSLHKGAPLGPISCPGTPTVCRPCLLAPPLGLSFLLGQTGRITVPTQGPLGRV